MSLLIFGPQVCLSKPFPSRNQTLIFKFLPDSPSGKTQIHIHISGNRKTKVFPQNMLFFFFKKKVLLSIHLFSSCPWVLFLPSFFFSPATLNQPPSLVNSSAMTSLESISSPSPPLKADPVISHLRYCTSCQTCASGPRVHVNPRMHSVTFPKCKSLYFASLVKTLP